MAAFNGFSSQVKKFFEDLRDNNNKEWFAENKSFYDNEIKETSKSLVTEMSGRFAESWLPFVADTKKSLFRINRDIRFSANKDPYKTNLGIYFPFSIAHTSVKDPQSVGLYFHIDHSETFIAGGLHMPDSNVLQLMRKRISEDWDELEAILKNPAFASEFSSGLVGEKLKRIPRGYDETHPAADWLKLKEYTVYGNIDFKDTTSAGLLKIIERKATSIVPFLKFISDTISGQ